MSYVAVISLSSKTKIGRTIAGILGSSLLFTITPKMLAYFLSTLSGNVNLALSREGYLYVKSNDDTSPGYRITHIISEDAEILWERATSHHQHYQATMDPFE